MGHNHITISERESICKGVSQYLSRIEIAMSLKMSKSTISRELKRNSENGSYSPVAAGGANTNRDARTAKTDKKLSDKTLCDFVADKFLNRQ